MVEARRLAIPDVLELTLARHRDARGWFMESYRRSSWVAAGVTDQFVQDNVSLSLAPGTLRGLHYQAPPMAQAKLVMVSRGAIFDVAVDIRHGSPTFGQWVGATLTAEQGNQLYVPEGFAHGFLTLEVDTVVSYKVSREYSADHDRALRYDDPDLAIAWPEIGSVILSDKDRGAAILADVDTGFRAG